MPLCLRFTSIPHAVVKPTSTRSVTSLVCLKNRIQPRLPTSRIAPLQPHPFSTMAAPSADVKAIEQNRPIVISGPSGSGKSSILKKLFEEFPGKFGFSVSHTTRAPRAGEQDGREYHFTTKDSFQSLIADNGFIEHAQFGSNLYGTSIKAIADLSAKDLICILDIEIEGAKQVATHATFPRPWFLFLAPPSMEVLEQRLRSRGTDKEEDVRKRLDKAGEEIAWAKEGGVVDKLVVNDELDRAYKEVRDWIVEKTGL